MDTETEGSPAQSAQTDKAGRLGCRGMLTDLLELTQYNRLITPLTTPSGGVLHERRALFKNGFAMFTLSPNVFQRRKFGSSSKQFRLVKIKWYFSKHSEVERKKPQPALCISLRRQVASSAADLEKSRSKTKGIEENSLRCISPREDGSHVWQLHSMHPPDKGLPTKEMLSQHLKALHIRNM